MYKAIRSFRYQHPAEAGVAEFLETLTASWHDLGVCSHCKTHEAVTSSPMPETQVLQGKKLMRVTGFNLKFQCPRPCFDGNDNELHELTEGDRIASPCSSACLARENYERVPGSCEGMHRCLNVKGT